MISFNTAIENFNRVYEDRNSPEKHIFLNPHLEIIKDSSQKASFFDIVDALQFRKWEPTSETNSSEVFKKIQKLWLQAKCIYDNEPFSIYSRSKLINLFNLSIREGTFLNPTKLKEYEQQIQNYCEALYLCKLIAQAEEKLANLSKKIGLPTNLKTYYRSLEEKYEKVLFFQKTSEFQFLTKVKYTDPVRYLNVFIEEKKGQINKTYPELLEFFELAERAPTYSKKKKSVKANFTSEQIRNRLLTIFENSPKEMSTASDMQLLSLSYSIPKNSKMTLEEYQKFTKDMGEVHKNTIEILETNLRDLKENIEKFSKDEILAPEMVTIAIFSYKNLKEEILNKNTLPIFQSYPLIKTQNSYIQSLKKFIKIFKKIHTPLKDINKVAPSTITVKKNTLIQNRAKKFGQNFLLFLEIEQEILKEHFPILFGQPDYLSDKEATSQVKKEVEEAGSTYSILIKELSKIALASTSASTQRQTRKISPEYRRFLDLLVTTSTSLPSPEKFISSNLMHLMDNFFSEKEVKTLDKLIMSFEDLRKKTSHERMKAYCEEYVKLKSDASPLKKPSICEEKSFVSSIQTEEETTSIAKQDDLPIHIEEEQDTSCIVEQYGINIPTPPLSTTPPSSTGAIPKRTISHAASLEEGVPEFSDNARDNVRTLYSLRQLQSVHKEEKISKFHYHNHVTRWVLKPANALRDPAYKNLTKTEFNKQETLAFHSFPKIIDELLGTNYCQKKESIDENGNPIKTYRIPGMVIMQDIQHEGYFRYKINESQKICFHRFFTPERKSAFKKLDEDLNSTQYFSCKSLNIQCNPDNQIIRIDDPSHEMEIYIFPASINN